LEYCTQRRPQHPPVVGGAGGVGGPASLPLGLVHPPPAIITTVETIGQIATGETVWAVWCA
jgi:hypothetical protein